MKSSYSGTGMSNLQSQELPSAHPPRITLSARLALAQQADGCVKWLKAQGFDVIRVEKGACGPRIIIRPSPLCKKLDGTVAGYSRLASCNRNNELRYSFTYRFDCEVWWAESEAN